MNAGPRRVFITGATGFIGNALARTLAAGGAEIHALVRPSADRSRFNDIKVNWHEGDITDPPTLTPALTGASWIVHAAGRLGEAGVPESVYRQIHVDGTRNVMEAALAAGTCERFLHISSPGVLGQINGEPATEDFPYAPTNPYERAKADAEKVATNFSERGLPVIIARPEFVYGPGDRHVLRLFQAIQRVRFVFIDGGRHICHPTFIDDAVAGMLLCLESGRPGEIYHIAGPRAVTFRELCETIALSLGVAPPRLTIPRSLAMLFAAGSEALGKILGGKPVLNRLAVDFFTIDRKFSWQKAHHELGYTPQHELTKGIATTVTWYRQQGWL